MSDGADAASGGDQLAADLRGFGPLGVIAIIGIIAGNVLFIPLSALLVLAWAKRSHTPWREIGYSRPGSWVVTIGGGILFGIAFKLFMKAVVMPLLGADPINHAYHYLAGNFGILPRVFFMLVVGAGFGEETVFRGYMFERLGKLVGTSPAAKSAIVVVTAIWFGLDHYSMQGLAGAEQATIVGLVFGTIYAIRQRIWGLMVAHASFDLTALAIIYWNLESEVAHVFFS